MKVFGHGEIMKSDSIAGKIYLGVCAGSSSVGRQRKRRIDAMRD